MPTAIALCTPNIDYLVHTDKMPEPDGRSKLLDQSWQGGGNAATAVACIGHQGISAGIMAAIGDDPNGLAQIVEFKRHNVDVSHLISRPGQQTPFGMVISDQETNKRVFFVAPRNITAIQPEEIDEEYLLSAKYLLLDHNIPAARKAAQIMLEHGREVMFDASVYSPAMEEMLPYTSIFITSEDYFEARYAGRDVYECCREMIAKGPHTVIFTFGSKGCIGVGPEGEFSLPAFKVDNVVDTTGCGDTFHGAFIVGMERGYDTVGCARWASATSAFKACAIGCRAGQPTADLVEKFLETGEMDLSYIPENVRYYSSLHY